MENTSKPEVSLINILNAFKKNIITIVFALFSSFLVGFAFTLLQPTKYTASASLVSKSAINATTESQITSALVGDNFLSVAVDKLAEADINKLEGETITKEVLGTALSGKLLSENGVIYDISLVTEEKNAISAILIVVRSEFLDYLRNDPNLNSIGSNFELISSPTEPVSVGISKTMVYGVAGIIGIVISLVIIFVADVWKGSIYDAKDIASNNLIELKLPKKYKKVTVKNFLSWPTVPVDINQALTKGNNKKALVHIQNSIIAKVGFDNNVQVFYPTTKNSIHERFIEAYATNFVRNGKRVIVIDLDESVETFLNLKDEMFKGETPKAEAQTSLASNDKKVIVLSLDESDKKSLNSKKEIVKTKTTKAEKKAYDVVGIKDEQYPPSVVNNSVFLNYVKKLKKDYDFVIISAGLKVDEYRIILSKLATPIVSVYSDYTSKTDYRKTLYKLNDPKTITLIVD